MTATLARATAALLDADRAGDVLAGAGLELDGVTPGYLRFKPGSDAVVGMSIDRRGAAPARGYVRVWDTADRAEVRRWAAADPLDTPLGPSIRVLPDRPGVLFLYPSDARLHALPTDVDVLRYKPERRVVARVGDRVLRRFVDGRARVVFDRVRALASSPAGRYVTTPIDCIDDERTYVERFVTATADEVDGGEVAHALLAVHTSGLTFAPRRATDDVVQATFTGLRTMTLFAPELTALVEEVFARVWAARPHEYALAPVHGDMHAGQVVAGPRGPVIVDWERAGMGDPLLDLGSLAADLRAAGADDVEAVMVDRYLEGGGGRRARDLPFAIAEGLAEQALLAFRGVGPAWPETVARLLEQARDLLAPVPGAAVGPPRWEALYPRASGPWTCVLTDVGGARGFGVYEPATGAITRVRPEDDRNLRSLGAWLARGELVTYRVHKRAVVRTETAGRVRYVKVLKPREAEAVYRRATLLASLSDEIGGDFPEVPRLVDSSLDDGVVVFDEVPGVSLLALDLGGGLSDEQVAAVARGFVRLHGVDAAELGLAATAQRTLAAWVAAVETLDPSVSGRYRAGLAAIEQLPPRAAAPRSLVHGDLHDKNVLLEGDRVVLLDLDGVHAGDAVEEIGDFAAHFVLRAVQRGERHDRCGSDAERMIAAYADAGGSVDGVEAAVARSLFRLACLYRLRRKWQWITPSLLEQAETWATRASVVIPSSR